MLCSERDELVRSDDLTPVSSITNYVAGEVVRPAQRGAPNREVNP
jgi:hypothetical protein